MQVPSGSQRRGRLRRGGFASAKQVEAARDQVLAAATAAAGHEWTVTRWLRHWLSTLPLQVRPSTAASYHAHVQDHLIPHLGRLPLAGLTVGHLDAMFTALVERSPATPTKDKTNR